MASLLNSKLVQLHRGTHLEQLQLLPAGQGGAVLDQPMDQLRPKQSPSRSRYARNYAGLVIQGHNLMISFAFVFTRFRCQKQNRTLSYLI